MTDDLAEARSKLEAARAAIRTTPELALLADRLERIAAELARVAAKLDAAQPVLN